jgi:ABC-type glycerol-3-phosphate transport system permease component
MKRLLPTFEKRTEAVLPPQQFIVRLTRSLAVALVLIAVSLAIGMAGYHLLEHLSWIDSFLNAAMLLGGMGPVNAPVTADGKLFAGLYALYCGLAVILIAGIVLAPVAHRILHRFHMEDGGS